MFRPIRKKKNEISPEQAEQFANQARRHVERIVAQMGDNSGSPNQR